MLISIKDQTRLGYGVFFLWDNYTIRTEESFFNYF